MVDTSYDTLIGYDTIVAVMHLFSLTIDDRGDRTHSSVEDRRVLVHSSDSSLAAQVSAICTLHAV